MCKKVVALALFFLISFTVYASQTYDISWSKPQVSSQLQLSWLQDTNEIVTYTTNKEEGYDFAFSDWDKVRRSLHNYLRYKDENCILYYKPSGQNAELRFSLLAGADLVLSEKKPLNFQFYGMSMTGRFHKHLSFYSQIWMGHYNRDDIYIKEESPLIDSWTKTKNGKIHIDNVRGKLSYKRRWFEAGIGRGKYQIGSNISGSIILDDHANEYGYFHLDFTLGHFKYSVLNASLLPDSTTYYAGSDSPDFKYLENRFLTLHKVNWNPSPRYDLFIGEEVIYGGRSFDLSYLLPFVPIRITEHNLGDHDNVLIFAGGNLSLTQKNNIYFNFILDELRRSKIATDWWGNKYAFQLGYSYSFGRNFLQRQVLEFVLIRPWLYTHSKMFSKFSHDGCSLGFPYGSNLIGFFSETQFNILPRLKLALALGMVRQGETGADWQVNYNSAIEDIDNYETRLLAGNPANKYHQTAVFSWQPLAHHFLKLGVSNTYIAEEQSHNWQFYCSWLTKY